MAWDLSNYEAVEDRIDRFYKDHKDGRILTEIHSITPEKVIFKAYIYLGETLVATGFAYEKDGSSPVNKTSHIENAETSAIGRALANYNYAKKGARPSKEEMQKVVRTQSEPTFNLLCSGCGGNVNSAEASYSKNKYGKLLCRNCQKDQG